MTEFLSIDGGQIGCEVTGLTAAAEEVISAPPDLVWDLVADVTQVGGWSPECIQADWLGEPGRPQAGARFTGRNRFPNGFEYEVTCVVTEADRPRAFAWVVLDDSGDPARPSSSWRYRIDPLPGGCVVRQRFTHGPGASYLRAIAAKAPAAAEMIEARRDSLRVNMSATLRAMKAAAEAAAETDRRADDRQAWLGAAGNRHVQGERRARLRLLAGRRPQRRPAVPQPLGSVCRQLPSGASRTCSSRGVIPPELMGTMSIGQLDRTTRQSMSARKAM